MNSQEKNNGLKYYRINISALCCGSVDVAARSETEAKALAGKSEIRFFVEDFTDMEAREISEAGAGGSESVLFSSLCGYSEEAVTEPLILESEDWTCEEWRTLCKFAGRLPAERTQRIIFHAGQIERFISGKSTITVPALREDSAACADSKYLNYSINISALCYGCASVAAHNKMEAKALAETAEITFIDWDMEEMEVVSVREIPSGNNRSEPAPAGYSSHRITESLILDPEDWTCAEWKALCKFAGGLPAWRTQRIVIHANRMEAFAADEPETAAAAPGSPSPKENVEKEERTYIVTELCSHCMSEIEMRWDTGTMGFKAFCPACGERLMLCDACRHHPDARPCDYDSKSETCRYSRGAC